MRTQPSPEYIESLLASTSVDKSELFRTDRAVTLAPWEVPGQEHVVENFIDPDTLQLDFSTSTKLEDYQKDINRKKQTLPVAAPIVPTPAVEPAIPPSIETGASIEPNTPPLPKRTKKAPVTIVKPDTAATPAESKPKSAATKGADITVEEVKRRVSLFARAQELSASKIDADEDEDEDEDEDSKDDTNATPVTIGPTISPSTRFNVSPDYEPAGVGVVAPPKRIDTSLRPTIVKTRSDKQSTELKIERLRRGRFAAVIGAVAAVGCLIFALSKCAPESQASNAPQTSTDVELEMTTQDEAPAATLAPPTTLPPTTEAPTTTTTEAPKPIEFKVGLNEKIGTLNIPAICLDAEIYSHSEEENNWQLTGKAVIDRMTPDPAPVEYCEPRNAREAAFKAFTGIDYPTRSEQVAAVSQGGKVTQWKPIVGHARAADGGYTSVMPGQVGNVVLDGHRTKFSAALTDAGLLKPGDTARIAREDGRTYGYEVIGVEKLPANSTDDYKAFINYSHPGFMSTVTLISCGTELGMPGGAETRYTVRLGQKSVTETK